MGTTFLESDLGAIDFGLGWDLVRHHDPGYDFGDGVLAKGGNSMFFSSRLIIIPKYNAVLALSETHDCGLDVPTTLMRLFNTCPCLWFTKNHNHQIKYGCAR